jgi:hypothetical protein
MMAGLPFLAHGGSAPSCLQIFFFARAPNFINRYPVIPVLLAEVAFPIPLPRVFDYRIPEELEGTVRPGHRVWAPFGRRAKQMGMVLRLHEPEAGGLSPASLKTAGGAGGTVSGVGRAGPGLGPLDEPTLFLFFGRSPIYRFSPGPTASAQTAVPTPVASKNPHPFEPTGEQSAALSRLLPAIRAGNTRFLLRGWRPPEKRKFIDGPFPNPSPWAAGPSCLCLKLG